MAVVAANVFAGAANEKIVSGGTGGEIQAAIAAAFVLVRDARAENFPSRRKRFLHVIKLPWRNALRGVFFCIYNRERFFDVIYIKWHKGRLGWIVLKVSVSCPRQARVNRVKII